jgi:hypothetical protein
MAEGYIASSGNVHWMTPRTEIENVILPILDRVDLDPCSHPASHIPTMERLCGEDRDDDDGMMATWAGHVFVNPTYGERWNEKKMGPKPVRWRPMSAWIEKAALSHRQITLARTSCTVLMLLPSYTERRWLHETIAKSAAMVCFPRGRIAFDLPGEGTKGSSGHASLYALWSAERDVLSRAARVFADRGLVLPFR